MSTQDSEEEKIQKVEKTQKIDMLNGSVWDKLILFALPLAFSSILQQLFNAVDVAIAGKYAGADALAAVGANSALISVFVNLFVGLSVGSNVVIATLMGQKKTKDVPLVVHTSILLAVCCGFFILITLFPLSRNILRLIGTPEDVVDKATLYLRIYLLGMPFILLYNFGAAILRSVGDTRRPMIALTVSGILNTILNLGMVIGLGMGVEGVAIATTISNALSATIVITILLKEKSVIKLMPRKLRIEPVYLKKIVAVGLPAGFQGMIFSLSNVFIQTGINSFGKAAVAGSSAGLNYEYFSYYVSNSFAQAAVTFSSQNYGAGNLKRCRKICGISLMEGLLFTELLSCIFVIFRVPLVGLFTDDAAVMEYAIVRMLHVMAFEGMTCIYEASGGVMRGTGHSVIPAVLTIFGTVGFRIGWMFTVFNWSHQFGSLLWVYVASWIFNSITMLTAYYILVVRRERRERKLSTQI